MGTNTILAELQDKHLHQADIAETYAKIITGGETVDWFAINHGMRDRWSTSGLIRVKTMAWALIRKGGR